MRKIFGFALSRRQIIKGAGALAAGLAAPAMLRVNSALAAFPDRSRSSPLLHGAGRSISSPA